jgi:hypothetical protein
MNATEYNQRLEKTIVNVKAGDSWFNRSDGSGMEWQPCSQELYNAISLEFIGGGQ